MSLPLQLLKLFICLAVLAAFAAGEAVAQDLVIAWEHTHLTLTYTTEPHVSTELQTSSDLIQWTPAYAVRETVTKNPDETQVVQAVVIPIGDRMFFRLRRLPMQRLTVAWDAAADSSVVGYIIRLRRRGDIAIRRIDAGNTTVATVEVPEDGAFYSFDVISYNAAGLESEPSNGVSIISHTSACE